MGRNRRKSALEEEIEAGIENILKRVDSVLPLTEMDGKKVLTQCGHLIIVGVIMPGRVGG